MRMDADPGNVVVSPGTYRLARDFFEFEPLGRVEVKGKGEPQESEGGQNEVSEVPI